MCGRFLLTSPIDAIRSTFRVEGQANIPARYNIGPTQPVLSVRIGEEGNRELVALEWGLVPSWAKERMDKPLINARFETARVKPSFRGSFKRRRCLVPTNGWYEWKTEDGAKQPYLIEKPEGEMFAFAGLWDVWHGPGGEFWLETLAILTGPATGPLRQVHHRRPLVVEPHQFEAWLEPHDPIPRGFEASFRWTPEQAFHWRPVSRRVGNVRNDDPSLLDPPESNPQGSLF